MSSPSQYVPSSLQGGLAEDIASPTMHPKAHKRPCPSNDNDLDGDYCENDQQEGCGGGEGQQVRVVHIGRMFSGARMRMQAADVSTSRVLHAAGLPTVGSFGLPLHVCMQAPAVCKLCTPSQSTHLRSTRSTHLHRMPCAACHTWKIRAHACAALRAARDQWGATLRRSNHPILCHACHAMPYHTMPCHAMRSMHACRSATLGA